MTKTCTKCNQHKDLSEFHKHKNTKDGYMGHCKICKSSWSKEHYQKNRDSIIKRCRQYELSRPEWKRAKSLRYKRKKIYGITQADYDVMYMKQLGLCACCHEPFVKETPCIDHCHKTGKIRGILHNQCNRILGQAQDSIDKLQYAIEYLQKHIII